VRNWNAMFFPSPAHTAPLSEPDSEASRLAALHRYGVLDTLPEQGYDDITALASFICGTPVSLVSLVDSDRQWFKSVIGLGVVETPRDQSFCAHTIPTGNSLVIEDAQLDPRFAANPLVTGKPGIRFYAGAPIVAPGGHVLGTVCVIDTQPRTLTPAQLHALEALARQVMSLLELRRTIETNTRAADTMRTVEKLAVVGRLASAVAHEVNNPLQSMANLLHLATSAPTSQLKDVYLNQSLSELSRVSHTVRQTLRFHRQSEAARPTRLGELVESVLDLFSTRLEHTGVQVNVIDRQARPLLCFQADMHQVIANFIGNAVDAVTTTTHPAIEIRIRTRLTPTPGVSLTIADNGSGMDAPTQSRLFEPFHSTKAPRGTGLGLWVSKAVLDKHHAAIHMKTSQSTTRHGTVFTLFLPLQD
jgi:two-component system NtrC family sensor kinase